MRKDYGRHKHTNWQFLFVWLVQTAASAVFFLVSLGAVALCGWGILSYLTWIPDPEGVSIIHSYKAYPHIEMAVGFFKTLCTKNYFGCVILLLILFIIFIEALSVLLNRLAAVREIRRYDG